MSETSQTEISSELLPIYADIKGAVVRPGMYQIPQNARVLDLVNMAGGFTAEAAQNQVNFSQMVEDQMVIYVPTSAEDLSEWQEGQLGVRAEGPATTSTKVNLNKADSSELQQLNGIGEKKAAAIIAYRQENGSFNSVEELKKVSGIGDKIFDNLKDEIEV
ncbi:helix-hairpin-helix domain-containing protein [Vagococcus allomyrinae]|nr:helix-hairpin-helix domain-containing protein [Vagococcus allomyrinae]